nr:gamma-tubulin complex component 6-like isoform X2 [Hydra vulgaris]
MKMESRYIEAMSKEGCETCSIQDCFNKLCNIFLKKLTTKVSSFVRHNDAYFMQKLKKKLYESLYLSLYSPYISLSNFNKQIMKISLEPLNVYNMVAEKIFKLQIDGRTNEADQLYNCSQNLKALNNNSVDQVFLFLILLANDVNNKTNEKKLQFEKNSKFSSLFFQNDLRAMHIDNCGIDQFGSHPADFKFETNSEVFDLLPGSYFEGSTPCLYKQDHKESEFSCKTRLSLFGGLVSSHVTSINEKLSIPDLPMNFENFAEESLVSSKLFTDEGFVELSNFSTPSKSPEPSEQYEKHNLKSIWDYAFSLGKVLPSWENSHGAITSNKYISELGKKGFDCLYNIRISGIERIIGCSLQAVVISEEQLYRDSLHVLIGIHSESYNFCQDSCTFVPALNYRCSGYSAEAINGVMLKFAAVGTSYCRLNKFCLYYAENSLLYQNGGLVLKAFVNAMNNVLSSYWSAIFITEGKEEFSLMELWHMFSKFGSQLQFLTDLCLCSEAFQKAEHERPKFPVGASLLSYLYSLCIHNSSTQQYQILLYLFKAVTVPYITFISNWIFEGVCDDPYDEFFVKIDQKSLSYRDKQFWTNGFQMKHNKENIPLFLDSIAEEIFACGKTINLIKLVNSRHYLFEQPNAIPKIRITFSPTKLDLIEQDCKQYIKCVQESEQRDIINKKIQKLSKDEVWQTKIHKEKQAAKAALAQLRELEQTVRLAMQNKKKQLFNEVQNQFYAALEERNKKKEIKLEDDKHWLNEMKKRNEKEDHIQLKAREELEMFYQKISTQVDQREFHAHWLIRRFKLSDKRLQFLKKEEEIQEISLKRMNSNIPNAKLEIDFTDSAVTVMDSILESIKIGSKFLSSDSTKDDSDNCTNSSKDGCTVDTDDTYHRHTDLIDTTKLTEVGYEELFLPVRSTTPISIVRSTTPISAKTYNQEYSEAKELIYQEKIYNNNNATLSKNANKTLFFEKDAILNSPHTQEHSEAKELIYPNKLTSDNLLLSSSIGDEKTLKYYENKELCLENRMEKNVNQYADDKTKNLLNFNEQLESVVNALPIRNSNSEGSDTYNLLYPTDASDFRSSFSNLKSSKEKNVQTFSDQSLTSQVIVDTFPELVAENSHFLQYSENKLQMVHNALLSEGRETKTLLYHSEHLPDTFDSTRFSVSEGSDTYNLLYPTDNTNFQCTILSSRGCKQEGSEAKELIYPSPEPCSSQINESPTVFQVSVVEKGQVNCIDNQSKVDNSVLLLEKEKDKTKKLEHSPKTVDSIRTSHIQSLDTYKTYPTDVFDVQKNIASSRGYKLEGSAMKDLIYQSVDSVPQSSLKSSDFQGLVTKTVLNPNERMPNNVSSILPHLYPQRYPTLEQGVLKSLKKSEPAAKIKELMYPSVVLETPKKQTISNMTKEEIWMDSIVEPLQDNFEAMDLEPQPYRFGNQAMMSQNNLEVDNDTDFINQLPLETIINSSLRTTIQTQISLVNKSVVQYFIGDLDIEVHFDAFRKFLLLEDGEFGHSLCSQLFSKVSSGMNPQDFCNSIHLNNIIIEALRISLYASRIKYSNQLAFSLKSLPEHFNVSEVSVLDFLELRYGVPWPCNIVVTENSIIKYNKVFSFLLRLKKAGWSLQEVWLNLKKAGYSRKAASSPELRQLQLFRHEMQHFVNNLERYIVNQILHVSWREFQQDLRQKVHSLDDLHKCHVNYLNRIIFRSLLSKNATPVYKLITDIFGLILKFEGRLRLSPWENDKQTGYVKHPFFSKLKSIHETFKHCTEFLFSIISKLVRGGYQDHLDDLLLQVNFNDFYTTAVVKS